eukprot:TRINITY_DN21261_c0_g1_i1.p1 TRINITY_DN21261_c0_g1~~TRINITY_DN21261_c0_g1_i1.p1  ORF type:complete len:530 (+),score=82.14 TRINITY_DN21261_c0_g1_i1:74-1663(+)
MGDDDAWFSSIRPESAPRLPCMPVPVLSDSEITGIADASSGGAGLSSFHEAQRRGAVSMPLDSNFWDVLHAHQKSSAAARVEPLWRTAADPAAGIPAMSFNGRWLVGIQAAWEAFFPDTLSVVQEERDSAEAMCHVPPSFWVTHVEPLREHYDRLPPADDWLTVQTTGWQRPIRLPPDAWDRCCDAWEASHDCDLASRKAALEHVSSRKPAPTEPAKVEPAPAAAAWREPPRPSAVQPRSPDPAPPRREETYKHDPDAIPIRLQLHRRGTKVGFAVDHTLTIARVHASSVADLAGARVGQRVLAVGGVRVRVVSELHSALSQRIGSGIVLMYVLPPDPAAPAPFVQSPVTFATASTGLPHLGGIVSAPSPRRRRYPSPPHSPFCRHWGDMMSASSDGWPTLDNSPSPPRGQRLGPSTPAERCQSRRPPGSPPRRKGAGSPQREWGASLQVAASHGDRATRAPVPPELRWVGPRTPQAHAFAKPSRRRPDPSPASSAAASATRVHRSTSMTFAPGHTPSQWGRPAPDAEV